MGTGEPWHSPEEGKNIKKAHKLSIQLKNISDFSNSEGAKGVEHPKNNRLNLLRIFIIHSCLSGFYKLFSEDYLVN